MKSRFFLVVSILLLTAGRVPAQTYSKYMSKADKFYKVGDYDKAIPLYRRALKLKQGNLETTYKLGLAHLYGEDKLPALEYLKKAYSLDPKIDKQIEYQMGLAYIYHHEFLTAKDYFEKFSRKSISKRTNVQERIQQCIHADSLMKYSFEAEIVPVNAINSKFHDYTPLVSQNGEQLIFTSNRAGSTGGLRAGDGMYFEDIYVAKKEGDDWGSIENIGKGINQKFHDAAGSLSPDGKELYVYYEYEGGNIYVSHLKEGEWDEPEPLPKGINTAYWETSATITADGNTLYFASDRPGGQGGLDLYRTNKLENGDWGKPVNLGDKINTRYNEDAPYITPDGTRLYFSSAGHPGMGAEDIFYVDIIDGRLGSPQNLGFPINSVYFDSNFIPSADYKEGYFASLRPGGKGNADIFHVKLGPMVVNARVIASAPYEPDPVDNDSGNETAVAEKIVSSAPVDQDASTAVYYDDTILKNKKAKKVVSVLKGKVIDSKSGEALYAEIQLVDNTNSKVLARVTSNRKTGEFELVIPHGGNFGVSTRRSGYLFNSMNFEMPEFQEYMEIDTHIIMRKADAGSKVVLKNIFFDTGKSDLRTESLAELQRIKELLEDNPGLVVQINGHTDNVGNATMNKILSKKRAESVVNYLIAQGIADSRLSSKGYGEERPLVSNDDEAEGREINRRTEIEIIRNSEDSVAP